MGEQLENLVDYYIQLHNGKEVRYLDSAGIPEEMNFSEKCTYVDVIFDLSRLLGREDSETSKLLVKLDGEQ